MQLPIMYDNTKTGVKETGVTMSNCAPLAHDMYQNGHLSTREWTRDPYMARHFWAVIFLFTIFGMAAGCQRSANSENFIKIFPVSTRYVQLKSVIFLQG